MLRASQTTPALRAIEDISGFSRPSIHGSGRFGVGGVLGTIGNTANNPGGTSPLTLPYRLSHNPSAFSPFRHLPIPFYQ
jgi:hypothetical protein